MPGINLSDLSPKLQQTLRPYITATGNVEAAINMAREMGKLTPAFEKEISSLNGNKAWGVFDGFEKSELQKYNDDFAQALKDDPAHAFSTAAKKSVARDIAKNPQKYLPKTFKMASGRTVVYQKDQTTGKDTYKYYDATGKEITANAFKDAENVATMNYDAKSGKLATTAKPKEKSGWEQAGETLLAIATLPLTLFASCSTDDHEEIIPIAPVIINNTINITFDTASLTAFMQEAVGILNKIQNNTYSTNEELKALQDRLKEIHEAIVKLMTNQQEYAKNAEDYYKQILNVINGNQKLLQYIIDELADGNETLKQIKELMEKNNATQEEILEAITKCKYGLDKLHEDNDDIKKLLAQIEVALNKLPGELKAKFGDYFKAIITGIVDNGAKLDALTNLLKVVNQNIQAGNTAILNKLDKMQAVLDALFAKFTEFDAKTTNMLNAIATAIANMTAKIDKIDLDKIEETLSQILDKIGNNKTAMENITKLLEQINSNTVLNGKTQQEILEAINKLGISITGDLTTIINKMGGDSNLAAKMDDLIALLKQMDKNNGERNQKVLDAIADMNGNMSAQFAKLIEIGNKNNALQGTTNALINTVIELIKNLDIKPDSPTQVDLSALIEAINANGADISTKLSEVYALLTTLNANVVQGNNDNKTTLCKILEAISKKTDLSEVLDKLDDILKAIKDHKVTIDVNGNISCGCSCGNDGAHEGVINDLEWLLG